MNTYPLENLPFDRARATDFRCYAIVAHVIMNYPKVKNIAVGATLTKWLDITADVSDSYRTKMIEALERAQEIKVPEQNGKGKVSPVEVIFIVHPRQRHQGSEKSRSIGEGDTGGCSGGFPRRPDECFSWEAYA